MNTVLGICYQICVLFSQGFTTMILNCSQEMHNIGYAWRGLKEQLGEGIDEHIKRMTFLKGKMVRQCFTEATYTLQINSVVSSPFTP